ncbi:MAG: hypothetical protein U9O20_01520 [Patescibacteria group bacterium]|nr:hypothetical protein [Patescibacteria group bacterium]
MKRKQKKSIETEQIIFSGILLAVGIFVISFFTLTMLRIGIEGRDDYILKTQTVQNNPQQITTTSTSTGRGSAQTLIFAGALTFSVLGGVIFLGLKINDKYN